MIEENWMAMSAAERADHLREAFKDMIEYQDAVIAELEARIMALEERAANFARIDRVIAVNH